MGLMGLMEILSTSNIPYIAAFFIGLMMSITPCPLATNITAIAYISKHLKNKKAFVIALFYALGRMLTYVLLASLIVWFGLNVQKISLFLQTYAYSFLGPLLILIGLVMLNIIKFKISGSNKLDKLKLNLAKKGYLGSLLLGMIFALAFCPFSAVLFFGMLIPLALKFGDGIIIPAIFSIATALPVLILSLILVYSVSKLGNIMNKISIFEKWTRIIVSIIFIVIGLYYTLTVTIGLF